jgi:hypothetical protein
MLYGMALDGIPGWRIRNPDPGGGLLRREARQFVGGSDGARVDFADVQALARGFGADGG